MVVRRRSSFFEERDARHAWNTLSDARKQRILELRHQIPARDEYQYMREVCRKLYKKIEDRKSPWLDMVISLETHFGDGSKELKRRWRIGDLEVVAAFAVCFGTDWEKMYKGLGRAWRALGPPEDGKGASCRAFLACAVAFMGEDQEQGGVDEDEDFGLSALFEEQSSASTPSATSDHSTFSPAAAGSITPATTNSSTPAASTPTTPSSGGTGSPASPRRPTTEDLWLQMSAYRRRMVAHLLHEIDNLTDCTPRTYMLDIAYALSERNGNLARSIRRYVDLLELDARFWPVADLGQVKELARTYGRNSGRAADRLSRWAEENDFRAGESFWECDLKDVLEG